MRATPFAPQPADAPDAAAHDPVRALLRRWFVEYNPMYLLSAALVLGGLWLVSQAAAQEGSALGQLGVAAIAELYALALIGGAALLTRIGLRRPAVMLALLTVVYQCDVTLHVETCAYLGAVGRFAAAAWVLLFAGKLYALARALELRPSRSAILIPTAGALGLALLPQLFRQLEPEARGSLVALWAFGVGAAGIWTSRTVRTDAPFDARGRRALRATWAIFAALGAAHVFYWVAELSVPPAALLPVPALLATRWARRESTIWAVALATLAGVALLAPTSLSTTAWMVVAALVLRAFRSPVAHAQPPAAAVPPYRGLVLAGPTDAPIEVFTRADPAAMTRLLLGAGWSAHLALWTLGWSGGAWPDHHLALDVALIVTGALAAWRLRRALPLAPGVATAAHLMVQLGWLTAPQSHLQWGAATIGLGFAFLAGALVTSWRLRSGRSSTAFEVDPPPL